jgi:hypothetical protein
LDAESLGDGFRGLYGPAEVGRVDARGGIRGHKRAHCVGDARGLNAAEGRELAVVPAAHDAVKVVL